MTWHHNPGAAKVPRVSVPKPAMPKVAKAPARPAAAKPAMPHGKTGVYDAKKAKMGTFKKGKI